MKLFRLKLPKIASKLVASLIILAMASTAVAQIEEIIVTSTKRQTTLQEIPIAVTVVDHTIIEQSRILDLKDLQSVVPALRVNQLQSSQNTNFSIRGFGNGANNAGIEPSVGVFIDGVYRSRTSSQIGDLPRLERIEVLSGPQSTLFGKNASVGVISVATQKPQHELEGYVEVGFGAFNETTAKGYITDSINEQLAFSLGAGLTQRDGYATPTLSNLNEVNDRNRWNVRGQVLFNPSENQEWRFIADYSTIDENCCHVTNVVSSGVSEVIQQQNGGQPAAANPNDAFAYVNYQNKDGINQIDDYGFSLYGDINFESFDLTTITAYRSNDSFYDTDADYSLRDSLEGVSYDQKLSTFTQEIRLTSNTEDAKLDWLVGGFLFVEDVDFQGGLEYGPDLRGYVEGLLGGALPFFTGIESFQQAIDSDNFNSFFNGDQEITENFTQDNTSYSIFGTVDYHFTEKLTLTVGANYTQDKKTITGSTDNEDYYSSLNLSLPIYQDNIFTPSLTPSVSNAIFTGGNADFNLPSFQDATMALAPGGLEPTADNIAFVRDLALTVPDLAAYFAGADAIIAGGIAATSADILEGLQGLQFQPQFLEIPNAVENGESDDSELTWQARLAYELNDNINIYGSVATGFKATSWNLARDSRPFLADRAALEAATLDLPNNLVYISRFSKPESSIVYEIGAKAKFDEVSFNLALFTQTIDDLQTNLFIGTFFSFDNIQEQSVNGLEFDITYQPTDDLTLKLAGTLLDPTYDRYFERTGLEVDDLLDRSGETPDNINETSLSFLANYNFELTDGISGFIQVDYQYESPTQLSGGQTLERLALAATPTNLGATIDFTPGYEERSQSIVNASLGLRFENDIEVLIWGRNVFNDQYFTTLFPGVAQQGVVQAYPSAPPFYGVSIKKNF